jgi:hypothetical protein
MLSVYYDVLCCPHSSPESSPCTLRGVGPLHYIEVHKSERYHVNKTKSLADPIARRSGGESVIEASARGVCERGQVEMKGKEGGCTYFREVLLTTLSVMFVPLFMSTSFAT